jgi:hypothetical protein
MDAQEQRTFWDRHITGWSNSSYNKKTSMPLIERVAQPMRKHLPLRQHFAVELMGASKTLKNYLGMDIAESAVKEARQNVLAAAGSRVTADVRVSAIEDLDPTAYDSFDFVAGLGLLPYLTDDGLTRLSRICKGKPWVMDYHPREATVFNGIHAIYRAVKGYPFYRMYSDSEEKELMAKFGFAPYKLISRGPLRLMQSV